MWILVLAKQTHSHTVHLTSPPPTRPYLLFASQTLLGKPFCLNLFRTDTLLNILNPPRPTLSQRSVHCLGLRHVLSAAAASYHHCFGSLHCLPELHANATVIDVAAMMM